MPRRDKFDPVSSFSDLAMGLMAVLALILLLLLWHQASNNAQLEGEKRQLEAQRARFALELLGVVQQTYRTVKDQDGAEALVLQLFREQECELEVDPVTGSLQLQEGGHTSADLYAPGETRLHAKGEKALTSCRQAFVRLASCLGPAGEDDGGGPQAKERSARCLGNALGEQGRERAEQAAQLRRGIEALTLEGSTDSQPYAGGVLPIRNARGGVLQLDRTSEAFVDNAQLGAERARQALGHLLGLLEDHAQDEADALPVLLNRVRIESSSFGRYQAGPRSWREPGREAMCDEKEECPAARNLSLRLRWRKESLRAPFTTIRERICALLADGNSAFAQGLLATSDPQLRQQLEKDPRAQELLQQDVTPKELATQLGCGTAPGAP